MKSEVKEVATCRYKLEVEIPVEEVAKQFNKAYDSLRNRIQLKGFRQGHAPRQLIRRRYGEEIARDVASQLFQDSFVNALKERELSPLGEPDINLSALNAQEDAPFAYSTEVDVRPKFEMPEYKGITLNSSQLKVEESAVDEKLAQLSKGFATYTESAEGFKADDALFSDLTMTADGAEIMKREDFRLPSGANYLMGLEIKDLQDQLAGIKAGAVKEFAVDVPESYYQKDAAGKKAVIKLAVKKIESPVYPAVDDEMAKRVGFENLEGLKARIRENLEAENKGKARAELEKAAVDLLLSKVNFSLPQEYIARQVQVRTGRQRAMLEASGGEEGGAEKIAEMEKAARDEAEQMTRRMVLLDAVADKENIEITQEDLWQHIQRLAQMYGMKPDQMVKQIQKMDAMMYVAQEVRERKAVGFLVDNAKVGGQ